MTELADKRFFGFRGFMKSGTNWVGNLLNLHPDISCIGELHLQSVFQTMQRDLRSLPVMSSPQVRRTVRDHLQEMFRKTIVTLNDSSATVVGERTPHTLAPLALRDARWITIIRDGRDVLVSRMFHLFNFPEVSRVFQRFPELDETRRKFSDNKWYFHEHPDQLLSCEDVVRESMRWWKEHLESDRRTIARHPGLPVLTVRYEDFHQDIDVQRNRMYRFLQVRPESAAAVPDSLRPKLDQERPDEFNRKGEVGDWKNWIRDDARRWINEEAGEELIRQGYIDSQNW